MGRFSQIAVMIHDLELGVALHAMIAALKPGVFAYSLCKKQPMSMNKKWCRATDFIQMEELFEYRDKVRRRDQRKPDSNKEKLKPVKEKDFNRQLK